MGAEPEHAPDPAADRESERESDRDFVARAARRAIVVAVAAAALFAVFYVLKGALTPLAAAFVIAYLLDPLIDHFEKRRVPRSLAIFLLLAAVGGAVLGGFGRFGRRKPKEEPKKEEPKQEQTPPQQQQPQQGSASLMEMTVEMSGLTQAPVDASRFQVPSGFKMVESPMKKMSQQ